MWFNALWTPTESALAARGVEQHPGGITWTQLTAPLEVHPASTRLHVSGMMSSSHALRSSVQCCALEDALKEDTTVWKTSEGCLPQTAMYEWQIQPCMTDAEGELQPLSLHTPSVISPLISSSLFVPTYEIHAGWEVCCRFNCQHFDQSDQNEASCLS